MSTPVTTDELDLDGIERMLAEAEIPRGSRRMRQVAAGEYLIKIAPTLIAAARELATLKAQLADTTASLECSHCGGDSITSPTGLFGDGDGGKCADCGMPGRVSADGEGAYWLTSDDPDDRCERDDCSECPPKREPAPSDEADRNFRTWNPGNHGTPGGVT